MEHHQNQLILVTLSGYFCLELSCARISARRAGEPALLLPWNRTRIDLHYLLDVALKQPGRKL